MISSCWTCGAYRGANGEGKEESYGSAAYSFLGPQQVAWLKRKLVNSQATWKVIAAVMPIGLIVVYDGRATDRPAGASSKSPTFCPSSNTQGCATPSGSRQTSPYTAAHYFDPNKAVWEFVSGPLHAGRFGPKELDNTFGPRLAYIKAPTKEQGQNVPPSGGLQFFVDVKIDGATEAMTMTLKDVDDCSLWSTQLEPRFGRSSR